MDKGCYQIQNYRQNLNYGEQLLNEPYSIAVVFLRTVNLTTAWQLGTESFTKLKAGLIIKMKFNTYALLQICKLIMLLKLKKTPKNISKIHLENDQHCYLLYLIEYSVVIMVKKVTKNKYLAMNCSRCLKEQSKLIWFSSGSSAWDDHAYCKECWKRLFKLLPEKVKKTFAFYQSQKGDK